MSNEIWKDIAGYEGVYQVSNLGRVRSIRRKTNTICGKILTPILTYQGYERVRLYKNGKSRLFLVHRLVAGAFVVNLDNKPMVNHIDENKRNNCANNLEWCTHIENCYHGTAIKRTKEALTNHPKKSKPVEQHTKDGELIGIFPSIREAERSTNIKHRDISFCCQERYKTAGGYIWKYRTV